MGHTGGTVTTSSLYLTPGTGQIWLDNIGCSGDELKLSSCTVTWSPAGRSHSNDVGIGCQISIPNKNDSRARLVDIDGNVVMGGTYKSVKNCNE